MNKKIILALLLLISILISACSNSESGNSQGEDTGLTETVVGDDIEETAKETIPEPDLPNMKFDGDEFTFLIRSRDAGSYQEVEVYTEQMDGEVVNDAVYSRNMMVEERFNIKINVMEQTDEYATASKLILAGDDSFDVMYNTRASLGQLAYNGYLVDLKTVDYLNLQAEYWDANAYEQLQIAGKLYAMPSDISMQNLRGARLIFFNKKILNDHDLHDPYEHVYADTWTIDVLMDMIKAVSSDLNGDGVMDKEDLFGMLTEKGASNSNVLYFTIGSGIRFTKSTESGIEITYMTEKTQSVIDKTRDVLLNPELCIEYNTVSKGADLSGYAHLYIWARSVLFTTDHFLFLQSGVAETSSFTNMESDYGIVPNPKFDEQQENYHHKLDVYNTILSIPVTNTEHDKTGMILEYMAYQSNKLVVPAYFETTVKTKRFRDENAANMLEIVKHSLYYDVTDVFFNMIGTSPAAVIYNAFENGNLASEHAKSESSMQLKLDDIYETIKSNQ